MFLTTGGAGAAVAASTGGEFNMPAYYMVKWITWKEKKTPIITQSENGPCPLLAIMNTLFLRWKVDLTPPLRPDSDLCDLQTLSFNRFVCRRSFRLRLKSSLLKI